MVVEKDVHPVGFRYDEAKQVFDYIRAGESASVIGVSGIGKSNLLRHLCNWQNQSKHLKSAADSTIIVLVNFHYAPDYSNRTIYSLILSQLEFLNDDSERPQLTSDIINNISRQHEKLLDVGDDVLKTQRYFDLALRPILAGTDQHLVLLFDQFDPVYQEADAQLFANLRALREAYKYRVSYILFTRDFLPNLIETDAAREEFYELMVLNLIGLHPYNEIDSMSLVQRIAHRHQLYWDEDIARNLYRITGGHAGLLRASYLSCAKDNLDLTGDLSVDVTTLLSLPVVDMECQKFWNSFSLIEKRTFSRQAHDIGLDEQNNDVMRQLQFKGMLTEYTTVDVFSPLFKEYIKKQENVWQRPLFFDESTRQVWVLGQPKPALTRLEYQLFKALYDRLDEIVTKDELIEAVWPEAMGGITNENLTTTIGRLRKKIEPNPGTQRFLENVRNQGYKLSAD
jgi:DNA-binding winged helix-turn-helix (wHTH) protein